MSVTVKIGTRDSQLALWQASQVVDRLNHLGVRSEILKIKSEGDLNQVDPLEKLGTVGIFTKALDDALLDNKCDIAVHSCKDLPTSMDRSLQISAYLERGNHLDTLLVKGNTDFLKNESSNASIATGSIRRKAQWLNKYPNHTIENLRGNVNTRLAKLDNNNWNGAIFAKAGLERLDLLPQNSIDLPWMIPAPAQGVMAVVCRADDHQIANIISKFNHQITEITSIVERDFLRILEGGCTAPIGILAKAIAGKITISAAIFSLDGKQTSSVMLEENASSYQELGNKAAQIVLSKGATSILKEIELNAH